MLSRFTRTFSISVELGVIAEFVETFPIVAFLTKNARLLWLHTFQYEDYLKPARAIGIRPSDAERLKIIAIAHLLMVLLELFSKHHQQNLLLTSHMNRYWFVFPVYRPAPSMHPCFLPELLN
jgi:hypothetical protein